MEKTLATEGDDDIVYDSFDAMNLKEDLLRGIYEYGYKELSRLQQGGIVPFGEGFTLVQRMPGPGRTSTFCIGVLQQLDIDMHNCQCLILAYGSSQIKEIAETMRKLGQFLDVKVYACLEVAGEISIDSHVVVGRVDHVLTLLEKRSILCSEEIKMVVLDDANILLHLDYHMDEVYKIIEYLKVNARNPVQIGAFYETMPKETLEKIDNKMGPYQLVVQECGLSLHGIKKHKFVNVEKEDLKVKELEKFIDKIRRVAPTMVFVSNPSRLVSLTKELENNGYTISVVRSCMDQKEREEITKDFLQSTGVILTTPLLSRGIIEECGNEVRFIVNYDMCRDFGDYIEQVGYFQRADAAITFATSDDWDYLVWLQEEYNIIIERLQLSSQNWAEFWKEETVSANKEAPIKHFIFNVGDEKGKVDAIVNCECGVYDEFDIARTSVIFVNCSEQILLVADELKKLGSKYSVHTSKDSLLHDVDTRSRVFITTDEELDVTVKVHLVINFDVPLAGDNYYRRLGWCKTNGIFLLLATNVDWFEVLDMQVLYDVFITWVPRDVADILQEMVSTETSPSTSKKPRTRDQFNN